METLRKSSQEVEIDHLLAEEFCCDPGFADRFLSECGLSEPGFLVKEAIPEPSLGSAGFGDLLVKGSAQGRGVALLIEDKITAHPATRQAARYGEYAERLRSEGWEAVYCILVAPANYTGERERFDAALDLEVIADLLEATDPTRLAYRQRIIRRAIAKKNASGVRVPDPSLRILRSQYLEFARVWCARQDVALTFPELRAAYYDGDSWIEPIRRPMMPSSIWLRHRLWTSFSNAAGRVDLVFSPIDQEQKARLRQMKPDEAIAEDYGSRKDGHQVSFCVSEMRQSRGFSETAAKEALEAMRRLFEWYEAALSADEPGRG